MASEILQAVPINLRALLAHMIHDGQDTASYVFCAGLNTTDHVARAITVTINNVVLNYTATNAKMVPDYI